jgi:L-histidine Nalpha-methyltransferase
MHLVSNRAQTVHLDGREFRFVEGEYITTEYSYKYTVPGFAGLALRAGFELIRNWEDRDHLFSVLFLRVRDCKPGPRGVVPGFNGTPSKARESWDKGRAAP